MTVIAPAPHAPSSRRVTATVRIHLANPWAIIITPWLITAAIFLMNFAIWHIVLMAVGSKEITPDAFHYNGGITWLVVYMVVVAVQAMNQTFSFVVGLGATRRDYFLGTSLIFVGLAVMFGGGVSLLAGLERVTDGWGVGGWFFAPGAFATMPLWEIAATYILGLLFMFFVGSAVAAVFVRWGSNGLLIFFAVVALLVVATLWGITQANEWSTVSDFVKSRTPLELALTTVPFATLGGLVGYALMRRATPKG